MHEIVKGEIPFVRILVPLIAGIAMALFYASAQSFLVGRILLATFCAVFAGILMLYSHFNIYKRKWLPGALFHGIVFLLAYCTTVGVSGKWDAGNFSKTKHDALAVMIVSEPKLSGDILRFETDVQQGLIANAFHTASGKLLVALKTGSAYSNQYKYGDVLLIPAEYNEVEPPYNPAEFNFKEYLANHAIYFQAFIRQGQVQLLKHDAGNPVISFSYALREKLVEKFNRYIHNKDAAAVASTLILGYRADLGRDVLDAYSKTGTMHVLSVSGMHVGIVFILLSFFLKFMDRSKALRLIRAAFMILLIWFYAVLTGFSPSVCRAALMLTIVVLGKAINRRANGYNLVAASAVLLLLYNPYFLVDVGFQLSYLAVLGLIYLYPKVYHLFYFKRWIADQLWSYASLSTSAQAATFPVSMYYFHQFPVYFLISNIFILLPVTGIMYAGLAFIIIPINSVQEILGWILEKLIIFTNNGLFYIENMPFANLGDIWISTWYYLLIYVFLFLLIFGLLYQDKRLLYASAGCLVLLCGSTAIQKTMLLQQKQVVFYSLRKNTAVGFLDGDSAALFTDLVTNDKALAFSVKPSLGAWGIAKTRTILPGEQYASNTLFSDGHFLQYRNWKLLICDSTFNYKRYAEPVFVDAVLLRGNTKVKVKSLASWLHFNTVFVDGTNPDYRIHQWQQEAGKLGCKLYVLKKNPAYIVEL